MSGEWKREVGYVGKTPEYWDSESGYQTHPRHSSTRLVNCYPVVNQAQMRPLRTRTPEESIFSDPGRGRAMCRGSVGRAGPEASETILHRFSNDTREYILF